MKNYNATYASTDQIRKAAKDIYDINFYIPGEVKKLNGEIGKIAQALINLPSGEDDADDLMKLSFSLWDKAKLLDDALKGAQIDIKRCADCIDDSMEVSVGYFEEGKYNLPDGESSKKSSKKGKTKSKSDSKSDDKTAKTSTDGTNADHSGKSGYVSPVVPVVPYVPKPNDDDNKSTTPTDSDKNKKPATDDDNPTNKIEPQVNPQPAPDDDNPTNKIEPQVNPNPSPSKPSSSPTPSQPTTTPTPEQNSSSQQQSPSYTEEQPAVNTPATPQQTEQQASAATDIGADYSNNYSNNYSNTGSATGNTTTPNEEVSSAEEVTEQVTDSAKSSVVGAAKDLFSKDKQTTTKPSTSLPKSSSSSNSSSSEKGFNPVPLAVGLGAAVAGGIGIKAYKDHKENSSFNDENEDSFTNGNRFWSDEEPNVINSELNEVSGDSLLEEQTTTPAYEAMSNGNNDSWNVEEAIPENTDTFDLLGEN